jgi:hypothetical protein
MVFQSNATFNQIEQKQMTSPVKMLNNILVKWDCHQKGRAQQPHDPSVELTQTEYGWVSVYQTSSITMVLI